MPVSEKEHGHGISLAVHYMEVSEHWSQVGRIDSQAASIILDLTVELNVI